MKIEMTGFNELQRELKQLQDLGKRLDGHLGEVRFDPNDPESVERAIQDVYRLIDSHVGNIRQGSAAAQILADMKQSYREGILEEAAKARLKDEEE